MAESSNIAWTDSTWNTIVGCSKVSEGCHNCYAESLALRYKWSEHPWAARYAAENVKLKPHKLDLPLKWKEPKRVFVNSLSDVFHELVPFEYIDKMFAVMAMTPRHTYQILTKRPERMRLYMRETTTFGRVMTEYANAPDWLPVSKRKHSVEAFDWPLPNVVLGTSIENLRWTFRADILRETPAAVRFISAEPLLGTVTARGEPMFKDVPDASWDAREWFCMNGHLSKRYLKSEELGYAACLAAGCRLPVYLRGKPLDLTGIDQVIVGGESGPGHRPFDMEWAREVRDVAVASGTAFFMKQIGSFKNETHGALTETDGTCWHWAQEPGNLVPPTKEHDMATCPVALAEYQKANPQQELALT